MNEKIESAKAALEYIKTVNADKKAEIKAYDTKLFAMALLSGILLLCELLSASVLFALGKVFFAIVVAGIILSIASIVVVIVAFWDDRKENYSAKLDRDLFESNDISIFYRDQLNNMKINFVFLDKTLLKKKSLLFSASVCIFGAVGTIIACVVMFIIVMM